MLENQCYVVVRIDRDDKSISIVGVYTKPENASKACRDASKNDAADRETKYYDYQVHDGVLYV